MANRAILVFIALMVLAGAAIITTEMTEMLDSEQQATEYCGSEYENATTVWINEGQLNVVHCELENGTLVDVPDGVFS